MFSSGEYTIYVKATVKEDSEVNIYGGTIVDDLFYDLEDAIFRAKERCALIEKCTITIKLFPGDHYLLASPREYYKPKYVDAEL